MTISTYPTCQFRQSPISARAMMGNIVCDDCGCDHQHHKFTLDGWACINCECYCPNPPEEDE